MTRFLTLEAAKAECASSTAIWTRSAQVIPMHMPSSCASGTSRRSAAPMPRGSLLVSIESSIALCLPVEVRAAHVAGPVLAGAAVVAGPRSGGKVPVGLQHRPQVLAPGDGLMWLMW